MSVFTWSERYSVNIREIDEQHKKLIGMVDRLHDAMRQGQGKLILDKILKELIQYTRTHFAAEERIMKANGYPDYETHKSKHDKMCDKVANIYKDYQDGKVSITIDVMKFLQDWIDKHIMSTDKQYAPFLNGKGIA